MNLKISGIYALIHRETNRVYVGSSINIHKRLQGHRYHAKKGRPSCICAAIRKHGWGEFDVELVEAVQNKKELLEREEFWILFYDSASLKGFNTIAKPTTANCKSNFEYKPSSATLERMRLAQKNNTAGIERLRMLAIQRRGKPSSITPAGRKKISDFLSKRPITEKMKLVFAANRGRPMSEETIEKLRQSGLRYKPTKETIEKIRIGNTGKVRSQESRKNYSLAQRARPKHVIDKIAAWHTGRKRSDATRAKLSEMQKARWAKAKAAGVKNLLNKFRKCFPAKNKAQQHEFIF